MMTQGDITRPHNTQDDYQDPKANRGQDDAENRLDIRMMGGLCKDDIQFVTQRSRDWGQDDARMIRPKNKAHNKKRNEKSCHHPDL